MDLSKFFVIDDILSEEQHHRLFDTLKTLSFSSQWSSAKRRIETSWHWNYLFYQGQQFMPPLTDEEYELLKKTYPTIVPLWDRAKDIIAEKIGKHNLLRLYSNCNPYGTNAYIHQDDGDYTLVYYPATEWDSEWEGGTCFYDFNEYHGKGSFEAIKYVTYRPNRAVLFPASIPHRGMPVDRLCTVPRYVVAMKLQLDVNSPEYVQNYYKGNVK